MPGLERSAKYELTYSFKGHHRGPSSILHVMLDPKTITRSATNRTTFCVCLKKGRGMIKGQLRWRLFARGMSITNLKAHSRRWRIASQTVSNTLTRAYRLQFDSTIVHGACGVEVRCNISSTASRY